MENYLQEIKSLDKKIMIFYLGQYVSEDELKIIKLISILSDSLNTYFKNKNYSEALSEINVGVICVKPEFEQFFSVDAPVYTKERALLEFKVKFDFSKMASSNDEKRKSLILEKIFSEIPKTISGFEEIEFDIDKFTEDCTKFL